MGFAFRQDRLALAQPLRCFHHNSGVGWLLNPLNAAKLGRVLLERLCSRVDQKRHTAPLKLSRKLKAWTVT